MYEFVVSFKTRQCHMFHFEHYFHVNKVRGDTWKVPVFHVTNTVQLTPEARLGHEYGHRTRKERFSHIPKRLHNSLGGTKFHIVYKTKHTEYGINKHT